MKHNENGGDYDAHLFDYENIYIDHKYEAKQLPEVRKIMDDKYLIIKTIGEGRYAK